MRTGVAALLLICACGGPRQETPPATDQRAGDASPAPLITGAVQEATGPDRGHGVIAFSPDVFADPPRADSMRIHAAPDASSPVLAHFVFTLPSAMQYSYGLHGAEAGVMPNALEYGYEEDGLPFDSVTADWARVLYGTDPDGIARTGWVRLNEAVQVIRWTDVLPERPLFFADGIAPAFHASPGGRAVEIELTPARYDAGRSDYIMEPDSVNGAWMRVRLSTPSTYCEPDVVARDTTVWIRYLDAAGRPRVWYFTRGC